MQGSSKTRRVKTPARESGVLRFPDDIRIVRRCHGALHSFAEQLRNELDEAVRNATSRNLGPARHVQQICTFVLEQIAKPSVVVPRLQAPTGFAVTPDLALGLKHVNASALAERVDAWSKCIAALAPNEGKPFERKPLVIGDRKNRRPPAAPQDKAELARLTVLEREAQSLLELFRAAAAKFEQRLVAKPKRRERKPTGTAGMLTVPVGAKRLGVAPEKLRGWIASGELPASNVALAGSTRPLWRIDEKDLEQFAKSRQPAKKGRPVPQRRSKKKPGVKEYF